MPRFAKRLLWDLEGRIRSAGQCFFAHVTIAVSADGTRVPLGAIGLSTFVRDAEPSAGREAGKWLRQMKEVSVAGFGASRLIHVADRESDSYETLVKLDEGAHRFVLRLCRDKRLVQHSKAKPCKLYEQIRKVKAVVERDVSLSRRPAEGRNPIAYKAHPTREARAARLAIGAERLSLMRPEQQGKTSELPSSFEVNIVRVWELDPPQGETGVEWLLLTSEPIDTPSQLEMVVDHYRARWLIEEFFKALKSGCVLEERQLESYHSLRNALAVFMPIAWRMLCLRSQLRQDPNAPGAPLLEPDELYVLREIARRPLPDEPTRRDVAWAIAALGGHLRRNGEPGWRTLGDGFRILLAKVEGFRIAVKQRQTSDQS